MLKILAGQYPRPVDSQVLAVLVAELGFDLADGECEGHVAYLAEKGFASFEKREAAGIKIMLVRATPKGRDLVDEIEKDAGVDVRF